MPNLTGPRLKQKRQIQHSLSHYTSLEQQGIHTALLSSAEPNAFIMHTLNLYSFFPNNSARFYVVAKRRAPNWGKWRVKKDNLTHLALGIQNILIHGGRNTKDKKNLFTVARILLYSLFCQGLDSGYFSRILRAMFPKSYRQ